MVKSKLTPKQNVLLADPKAVCDYYELLRTAGKPCWFIRRGLQGPALSDICASPRAAWKNCYAGLVQSLCRPNKHRIILSRKAARSIKQSLMVS